MGDSPLFPNLYILLLANSSLHRKNRPIEFSESYVHAIAPNLKIISGRSSVEAILDELSRSETDENTGKVKKSSAAMFYAPELAAGIVSDSKGISTLTDIFDFKTNPYKHRLRTGPCFNLERLVFSMFSATNEDMIKSLFDASVIKGGFLARNMLVVPSESREPNALLRVDYEALAKSKATTLSSLTEMCKMHGELEFPNDAVEEYEAWYKPFNKSYAKKKESSGIIGRIHTHVLKVAMILAANDFSQCVQKRHVEEAINECIALLPNYSIFTMSHGKSELSQLGGLVITELLEAQEHMRSRKELVRKFWMEGLDSETLDKLAVTLETAGMVQQITSKDGMFIGLTKTCLEMLGQEQKQEQKCADVKNS